MPPPGSGAGIFRKFTTTFGITIRPSRYATLQRNGQQIPALGHANKSGFYYILDRRSGAPLFDVTETPVPVEPAWQKPWPRQPISAIDPLIPQTVASPPDGVRTGPCAAGTAYVGPAIV